MIDEIRYIFKMRIGCDGSRETLFIRNLITDEQLYCHCCGIIESRKHIFEVVNYITTQGICYKLKQKTMKNLVKQRNN